MPSPPGPSTISPEAALRLVTSAHPPLLVDARPPGLFALEHVRDAHHTPSLATLSSATTILVYDSGTRTLDGALTRGVQAVHHIVSQTLPTSPQVRLISGGLPALKCAAPHLITMLQFPSHPSFSNSSPSSSSATPPTAPDLVSNSDTDSDLDSSTSSLSNLLQSMSETTRRNLQQHPWARRALAATAAEAEPPARILPALYVGPAAHALDPAWLRRHHITHVLSAGHDLEFRGMLTPPSFIAHWRRVAVRDAVDEDLRPHFRAVCTFLDEARARRANAVVHCVAGASRSVALVAAYLVFHGWSVNDALVHIKALRRAANPNSSFLVQLQDWESYCSQRFQSPTNTTTTTTTTPTTTTNKAVKVSFSSSKTPIPSPVKTTCTATTSTTRTAAKTVTTTTNMPGTSPTGPSPYCFIPLVQPLEMDSARNDCLMSLEVSRPIASPRRITDGDLFSGCDAREIDDVEVRDSR